MLRPDGRPAAAKVSASPSGSLAWMGSDRIAGRVDLRPGVGDDDMGDRPVERLAVAGAPSEAVTVTL